MRHDVNPDHINGVKHTDGRRDCIEKFEFMGHVLGCLIEAH